MSVTSLSFTFVNMYAPQPSARPTAQAEKTNRAAPVEAVETQPRADHQHHQQGGKVNRLVQAMMSALQELGLGGSSSAAPAASPAAAPGAAANAATSPDTPAAPPTSGAASGGLPAALAAAVQGESAMATIQPVKTLTTMAAAPTAVSPTALSPSADAAASTAAAADDSNAVDGAATPSGSPAAAATTVAADKPVDLQSAVYAFAHELMKALRGPGQGGGGDGDGRRVDGEGGHRHGHHHGYDRGERNGWRQGGGYGDMSQRLQALSQTFAAPAATDAPASAGQAGSSLSITITLKAGDAMASDLPVTAGVDSASASTAAVAPAAPRNPLLDAFSNLFSALKGAGAASSADGDMGAKLQKFLQTLATAMRPDSGAPAANPSVGGLVNVSA